MCWGTGSFLASGILRGSLNIDGNWAWRVPYTLQWVRTIIALRLTISYGQFLFSSLLGSHLKVSKRSQLSA